METAEPARRGWPRGKKRGPRKITLTEEQRETAASIAESRAPQQETELPRQRAPLVAHQKPVYKMKAGNNWENAEEVGDINDRLAIHKDEWPEGFHLQWKTRSVWDKDETRSLNADYRGGWTPVHREDFDGRFASRWDEDAEGYVVYEACILCAIPEEIYKKKVQRDKTRAKEPLAMKEQAFRGGEVGATGGSHPSALAVNRINRSIERIDVPRDE